MDAKDQVVITKFSGIEEGGPRPNHPDFMTSTELKSTAFSGVRHNSLTEDVEVWLDGKIEIYISAKQRLLNPRALEEAWSEYFSIGEVKMAGKEK